VKEYELKKKNFSATGCFGFGITEHIDLGLKYDPATGKSWLYCFLCGRTREISCLCLPRCCRYSTGIFGMDFYIILIRPGYRVARRKIRPGKIGNHHRVKKEDAIKWFQDKYEGIVL
jgi:large subunit ribosomal protein L11e